MVWMPMKTQTFNRKLPGEARAPGDDQAKERKIN
jgi:hypothetical protein